jgi:hypothetical protein
VLQLSLAASIASSAWGLGHNSAAQLMCASRCSEEQMIGILHDHEMRARMAERRLGLVPEMPAIGGRLFPVSTRPEEPNQKRQKRPKGSRSGYPKTEDVDLFDVDEDGNLSFTLAGGLSCGLSGYETLMKPERSDHDGVITIHRTCASRNNLPNSLARPERAGLLPATRRGSLD